MPPPTLTPTHPTPPSSTSSPSPTTTTSRTPCSTKCATSATLLKEAEQFLWADHEMDPVRDMTNKMIEAQRWALNVRSCLSKLENCLDSQKILTEKVSLCELEELLSFDPLPCYEPGHIKLKAYFEEAKILVVEIQSALSSCLDVGELEKLHSRAIRFPINLDETRILEEICSTKDREDHTNIVAELSFIFKSGELLRLQVDELPVVETELKS